MKRSVCCVLCFGFVFVCSLAFAAPRSVGELTVLRNGKSQWGFNIRADHLFRFYEKDAKGKSKVIYIKATKEQIGHLYKRFTERGVMDAKSNHKGFDDVNYKNFCFVDFESHKPYRGKSLILSLDHPAVKAMYEECKAFVKRHASQAVKK